MQLTVFFRLRLCLSLQNTVTSSNPHSLTQTGTNYGGCQYRLAGPPGRVKTAEDESRLVPVSGFLTDAIDFAASQSLGGISTKGRLFRSTMTTRRAVYRVVSLRTVDRILHSG